MMIFSGEVLFMFDSKYIIIQYWVPQKENVNGKYYAKMLKPVLWNIIQNKKKLSVWSTSVFYFKMVHYHKLHKW